MNKDVIYIEPDDDITDIISKLKSAKQKVVALVPPKKIGVLRSAVNTKLIAKTAKKYEKAAVIVSTDPSLVKLAVAAGIPVAENLNSRPKLPSEFSPEELENPATPISIDERNLEDDDDDNSAETPVKSAMSAPKKVAKKAPDEELNSEDFEKAEDKKEAKKPGKKSKIPDLDKYKKFIIAGAALFVVLIGFLVWATVFAPSAKIAVSVRTTGSNFAEDVAFVSEASDAKPEDGILYLETKSSKKDTSVDFTATGKKDVGEKAHGTLQVGIYVKSNVQISSGTQFTADGLTFTADSGASLAVPEDLNKCENAAASIASGKGCLLYASINVTANEPGEKYNLSSGKSWTSGLPVDAKISNSSAFSGGTTKNITTVQQSDVDVARSKLEEGGDSGVKDELAKEFGDDYIVIESSYSVEASDPTANPAVGAEVPEGTTPKLTASTTYSLSAVKKSEVEDYIKAKSSDDLGADQKIYDIGTPFFEKFEKSGNNYVAKLKATVQTGPEISEEEILEKAKGKKTGEVQSLIKSINGVSSVKVETPFFWVNKVPNDNNKVEVELKVEE